MQCRCATDQIRTNDEDGDRWIVINELAGQTGSVEAGAAFAAVTAVVETCKANLCVVKIIQLAAGSRCDHKKGHCLPSIVASTSDFS